MNRTSCSRITSLSFRTSHFLVLLLAAALLLPASGQALAQDADAEQLAEEVEIRRTTYGVAHINGENLKAASFALGYIQVEDYGERVLRTLLSARGEESRVFGRQHLDSDFRNKQRHRRAIETFARLDQDVRDVKSGFAAGVNHYIRTHEDDLPDWAEPEFTAYDVAARDIGWANPNAVSSFVDRLEDNDDPRIAPDLYLLPDDEIEDPDELEALDHFDGSNSWAIAPERTEDGNAILMRNPHLSWEAGYHEVHFKVPGKINFYGDFRIGGPFTTVGGFNESLGFSTTNNAPHTREIYALQVDPDRVDHYLFDDASVAIERKTLSVDFRSGEGMGTENREKLFTHLGPVIHRADGWIYVLKEANHGEYRLGEQFLGMMMATNFEEWEESMRIRARPRSNFLYADREGNIHYKWSGSPPDLPHQSGGDTLAIPVSQTADVFNSLIPYDELPSLKNPEGGYVRNENDPFHLTNLHEPMAAADFPHFYPDPRLRLRSQHSLEILHNDRIFSLEDVVEAKHSLRMPLADRVKGDLLEAVRAKNPSEAASDAADMLEDWDNTVGAHVVGGVLFQEWWNQYVSIAAEGVSPREEDPALFRIPWSEDHALTSPQGLANYEAAAEAFEKAIAETEERWGAWDMPWGDVHRARRGDKDLPVGGCTGSLGCFRMLWFTNDDDGLRRVRGGDGWVFAVEFGEIPRAYSILAYGQSNDPDSPHHTDQLEKFTRNEMKEVHFTEDAIEAATIRRYHPGDE